MFRSRSRGNLGDSEREARFVQDRIDGVEKHFGELCNAFGAYSRKVGSLREKNDAVVSTIRTYAEEEDINRSTSLCLKNFADSLEVIADYRNVEAKRLEAKVVVPLKGYQETCRQARENVKSTFAARDQELKHKSTLDKVRDKSPSNQRRINKASESFIKASAEVNRVVRELERQIDAFEKSKLHDTKKILLDFVTVQLSFHVKAVELFTKAYQDVAEIDEAQDLEDYQIARGELNGEFREKLKSTESLSRLGSVKRSGGIRQALSLMNLPNRSSPSPTNFRKQKEHKTTESLDSLKTGHTSLSESVQVEEYDESTDDDDDSEEASSIPEKKSRKLAVKEDAQKSNRRLILKMVPAVPSYQKNLTSSLIHSISYS